MRLHVALLSFAMSGLSSRSCIEKLPVMEVFIPEAVEDAFGEACDGSGCHEGDQEPLLVPFAPTVLDQKASDGMPYVAFDPDLSQSKISALILSGEMPPGGGADPLDLAVILAWIAGVSLPDEEGEETSADDDPPADEDSDVPPVDANCAGPAAPSDPPVFTDVYTVLAGRCLGAACHDAAAPTLGDPEAALDALVGVASRVGLPFVEPGRPEESFLWLKLVATETPAALEPFGTNGGSPMPLGGTLCDADLLLVYAWILGLP